MRPELDYGDYLEWLTSSQGHGGKLPPRGRPYRLNTDLKAGFDWAHLIEVPRYLTLSEEQLAEKLREIYETRYTKELAA